MTDVFARLGRVVARHPVRALVAWGVLAAVGLALALVGVGGDTLFDRLTTGAAAVPGSESERGRDVLDAQDASGPALTLVLADVDPDDPAVATAMDAVRTDLVGLDGVASVIDPLGLPDGPSSAAAAPLVARGGDGFLVVVTLDAGLDDPEPTLDAVRARLEQVPDDLSAAAPDASGLVGGSSLVADQTRSQVARDVGVGSLVGLVLALLALVLVLGSLLAAALPLASAVAATGLGLGIMLVVAATGELDATATHASVLLTIGLAAACGLLLVARFREELRGLLDDDGGRRARRRRGDGAVAEAVERAMATTGRAIAFAAVAAVLSFGGVLLLRPVTLRAVALVGLVAVVAATAATLTLVPALLAAGGRRLAGPSSLARVPALGRVLERTAAAPADDGAYARTAGRVQRHPWAFLAGSVVVLLALAAPLLGVHLRHSSTELLPPGTTQREFVDALARDYPAASSPAVTVVAEASLEDVTGWAQRLTALDGVAAVDAPSAAGSYVTVGVRVTDHDSAGAAAQRVVRELRAEDAPFPTWVTGQAAAQVDVADAVRAGAPLAMVVAALATFLVLLLMTGSVALPLVVLAGNALVTAAAAGALVGLAGPLARLLGASSTGGVEASALALVVAGTSTVATLVALVVLGRTAELRTAGATDRDAVRAGVQRSGAALTAAGVVLVVVLAGFAAGRTVVPQQVAVALALGVLLDLVVVRLVLQPAALTALGHLAWSAPAALRRLHERLPTRS